MLIGNLIICDWFQFYHHPYSLKTGSTIHKYYWSIFSGQNNIIHVWNYSNVINKPLKEWRNEWGHIKRNWFFNIFWIAFATSSAEFSLTFIICQFLYLFLSKHFFFSPHSVLHSEKWKFCEQVIVLRNDRVYKLHWLVGLRLQVKIRIVFLDSTFILSLFPLHVY